MKHFSGWRIDVARLRGVSEEEAPPPLPVAATATLPAFFIALLKESGLRAVRAAALVLLLLLETREPCVVVRDDAISLYRCKAGRRGSRERERKRETV
jgi:hypothetical protein